MVFETATKEIQTQSTFEQGQHQLKNAASSLSCVQCMANTTTKGEHLFPFNRQQAEYPYRTTSDVHTSNSEQLLEQQELGETTMTSSPTVVGKTSEKLSDNFTDNSLQSGLHRMDSTTVINWGSTGEGNGLIETLLPSADPHEAVMDINQPYQLVELVSNESTSTFDTPNIKYNQASLENIGYLCLGNSSTILSNETLCTGATTNYVTQGANCINGTSNFGTTDCLVNITTTLPPVTLTLLDMALATFLSVFIICIIIGNMLVVSSVLLFREMRTLTNALIVSLAVADLLVAIIVLPLSLHFEIYDRVWTLGPIICDFWTTSDVFCCTASILNIVVIAMDRYWLITMNVRYTHSARFPRKRVCAVMVTLAWSLSLIISVSPLFGWNAGYEKQMTQGKCLISQDLGYTIFSTFGAFWFPLSVILITYFKIFKIARKRAQSRAKSRSICPSINTETIATDMLNSSLRSGRHSSETGDGKRSSMVNKRLLDHEDNEPDEHEENNVVQEPSPPPNQVKDNTEGQGHDLEVGNVKPNNCYTGQGHDLEEIKVKPAKCYTTTTTVNNNTNYLETSINSPGPTENMDEKSVFSENNGNCITLVDSGNHQGRRYSKANKDHGSLSQNKRNSTRNDSVNYNNGSTSLLKRDSSATTVFSKNNFRGKNHRRHFQRLGQCRSSRMRYRNRMRSSARTLGLIIGCFVLCWMPFFIIATVLPFCDVCAEHVPTVVSSVVLWLGYSNSLLNPAIYAIWDKNFRRSFKRVLKCKINWSHVW